MKNCFLGFVVLFVIVSFIYAVFDKTHKNCETTHQVKEQYEWQQLPCAHLESGHLLAECTNEYHTSVKKKMDTTFQAVINKVSDDHDAPKQQQYWFKSQAMWQAWVDYECENDTSWSGASAHGAIMVDMCKANKMQARERYLREKFRLGLVQ